VVTGLATVTTEIQIARLEGNLSELKTKLGLVIDRISALVETKRGAVWGIENTPLEMARDGCNP